ncbi:glycosyltransferase family 39 protein [Gloeobacter kilaueensis]|uniref:4-amino-4-deoxy-L-arabinose transferase-related glycosyltransferase of PMT family n=1 Tax=Gloeobacter kilaueensis (strain ATCC BAA-2537 / CCAP 1431/1 / ULC 316 / JS1) TaxID=1183438 RepID=U5QGE6_GLOK1|nr:glycosyltransferase family 39 protein [Gloeobacter kilaueensis]AGY56709.1 4-amino-4-deoxy-L-arabinose transferase-related glycosyltransferase of PMT family [Gloeobacter kilaueensis JS1]
MLIKTLYTRRYAILTAAVFVFLAVLSWGKHWNLLVDVGRDLETTVRIADGQLLYRDIQSYYTPFAYYCNAWLVNLFGRHLAVFYLISLAIKATLALAVYRLATRLLKESYAAAICCGVLVTFAFTPGNVNQSSFSMQYAGAFLALALVALQAYLLRPRPWLLPLMGVLSALGALSKQEYGVAAAAAILAALLLHHLSAEQTPWPIRVRQLLTAWLLFAGPLAAVTFVPLWWFLKQVGWQVLVEESLYPRSRFHLFTSSEMMQVSPLKTLFVWGRSALYFLLSSAPVIAVLVLLRRLIRDPAVLAIAATAIAFPLSYLFARLSHVSDLLPFNYLHWSIVLFIGAAAFYRPIVKAIGKPAALVLFALSVAVVVLNLRWLFTFELYDNYAVLLFVLFGLALGLLAPHLPQKISPLLYLAVCTGAMLLARTWEFARYDAPVESPRGTVLTPARQTRYQPAGMSAAFNQAIAFLDSHLAPAERGRVLVLPDGTLLNYLSATHSPARELTFLPGTIAGPQEEEAFIERMKRQTRFIVLVDRTYDGWAQKRYSQINPLIYEWVTRQNRLVARFPANADLIRIYQTATPRD